MEERRAGAFSYLYDVREPILVPDLFKARTGGFVEAGDHGVPRVGEAS